MLISFNKHTYKETLVFNIETGSYEYIPFVVEGRLFHTIYIIPANLPYGFSWASGKLLVTGSRTGGVFIEGWMLDEDEKWVIDRIGAASLLHPEFIEVGIESIEGKYGRWSPSQNNAWRATGSIEWMDMYTYEVSLERYVGFLTMMDTYYPLPNTN